MSAEKRKHPRKVVGQLGIIVKRDGSILGKCLMLDVSAGGAKLMPKTASAVPDKFVLVLSRDGRVRRRCTVAWRSETTMGVHFSAD